MNEIKDIANKLNIDKSNWITVKLGDLLEDINDRVKSPEESEYDRFVGLEHFVSGDIKIKDWKSTEGLASSAKAFKKGDILFARRNAYLRRASQVDFEGCCSGDAFVLREKKDEIIPGFLCFLMNSDALWDYANDNAAGTMSKRVKWRDLANYEFLLPPKEQQAELAELLWAMDEVIERKKGTINTLTEAQSSFRNEIFSGTYYNLEKRKDSKLGEVPSNWDVKPLNELVDESICYGIVQPGENTPGGIPVVQIKNLIEFKQDAMHFVDPDIEKPYSRSRISDKDILLAIKGTLGICNTVPRGFKGNIGRDTAKINITNRLMREYVLYLFRSSKYQLLFDRIKVGSTRYEISIATLRDLPILIPPVEIIEEIIRIFNSIDDSFMMIRKSLLLSQSLQKSLINQIF